MNPTKALLKHVRRQQVVSQYLPITHFNTDTIVETKNGALLSVIKVAGCAFDTKSDEVIDQLQDRWHRVVSHAHPSIAFHVAIHRQSIDQKMPSQFDDELAYEIDTRYQAALNAEKLFHNSLYVTIIARGLRYADKRNIGAKLLGFSATWLNQQRQSIRRQHVAWFEEQVQKVLQGLQQFSPQLLDSGTTTGSSLLAYFSQFVSAGKSVASHPVQHPLSCNISHILAQHHVFFHQCIQLGEASNDCRYAAMVSIKNYSLSTMPLMLNQLLRLPFEFVLCHHFLPIEKQISDSIMSRQLKKLVNTNSPAFSQYQAISSMRDDLLSEKIIMGDHQNSVMVIANDEQSLDQNVCDLIDSYTKAGLVAVRERIAQQAVFWSQIPSNFSLLCRRSMISSKNFVDMIPLHNYPAGEFCRNHLHSAVSLMRTIGRTPYWFHCHARGGSSTPSLGHTIIVGGSGSGKTVLMTFLEAQLRRFSGCSYCFDRDRGMELYWRASGGRYVRFTPDHDGFVAMNPFQINDSAAHRQFCVQWLTCLIDDGSQPVLAQHIEQLRECVDYCYDQLAWSYRNLRNVVSFLPTDFSHWPAVRRWLHGSGKYVEGDLAYLFDHDSDELDFKDKIGFDLSYYIDHKLDHVLLVICQYLLYRIERQLTGHLVSIFIDEAWQYFSNSYWQTTLATWLATFRKKNAHVIMATQSARTLVDSPLCHIILDNCATQLYFANPQAKTDAYCIGMGLSDTEFVAIKHNQPTDHVLLYKQGDESTLLQLDLTSLGDVLLLMSSSQQALRALDDLSKGVSHTVSYQQLLDRILQCA